MLAVSAGMRGGEIKKLQLRLVDLEKWRITIEHANTPKGNRTVELNINSFFCRRETVGTRAKTRCERARALPFACRPHSTYRRSRPRTAFDATRRQATWDTAWRNLRAAAVESI